MSERLRARFAEVNGEGRAAFVAYTMAGFPTAELTVPVLLGLEAGGADVIELGVPFTDPLADGATIQRANEVAVAAGVTFADCLEMVREARTQGLSAPLVLMGYDNPLLAYGEQRAAADAAAAGADGFIVVDLPPDEAGTFRAACAEQGVSFIPLIAPTTAEERMGEVASVADSFIYCVSVTGTTGQRSELPPEIGALVGTIREHTELPIVVGFGVSTREQVAEVGSVAEGVAVGSAIIAAIEGGSAEGCVERVRSYIERVTGRSGNGAQQSIPGE